MASAPEKKDTQSWDDKTADALPKKAKFYNAMRTNSFTNLNDTANYVEFWSAFQTDVKEDKWTVMHYMVHDLDADDGTFIAQPVAKDISFSEAVFRLSRLEFTTTTLQESMRDRTGVSPDAVLKLEGRYPPNEYPEMKVHFYDLEHYKVAANIEGIAFDQLNRPYRRVEGKIFADATFKRSEVVKSILAVEQASESDKARLRVEGGVLADVFNTVVNPGASLDDKLKIGLILSIMDNFAVQMAAYYILLQKTLGLDENLDKVTWLAPGDRADLYARVLRVIQEADGNSYIKRITGGILPNANKLLEEAQAQGVHVEPFVKHVTECEILINLIDVAQSVAKLDSGLMNANNTDISVITHIRETVKNAEAKFFELGGTAPGMDKLNAWAAAFSRAENDPAKQKEQNARMVPAWLPGFLSRYYQKRSEIMQKVQKRLATVRQVNVMGVEVKPPVSDAYNDTAAPPQNDNSAPPQNVNSAPPQPVQEPAPVPDSRLGDKYKTLADGGPAPKRG